jgi:hypothetical protein
VPQPLTECPLTGTLNNSKFFRACDSRPAGDPASTGFLQIGTRGSRAAFRAAPHEAPTMKAQVGGRGDAFRRPPQVWAGQRLAERLHC